jgi:hypothetical protein
MNKIKSISTYKQKNNRSNISYNLKWNFGDEETHKNRSGIHQLSMTDLICCQETPSHEVEIVYRNQRN